MKKCTEYEVEGSRPTGRPKGCEERLCKKIAKHAICTGKILFVQTHYSASK